jgi:hypothetical protein
MALEIREKFRLPSGATAFLFLSDIVSLAAEPDCDRGAPVTSPAPQTPTSSWAQALAMPLYIQTSQPWTVVLDAAGNPAVVILSEPPARPAHSALFGR